MYVRLQYTWCAIYLIQTHLHRMWVKQFLYSVARLICFECKIRTIRLRPSFQRAGNTATDLTFFIVEMLAASTILQRHVNEFRCATFLFGQLLRLYQFDCSDLQRLQSKYEDCCHFDQDITTKSTCVSWFKSIKQRRVSLTKLH